MVLANEANEAEAPDTEEEGRRERKRGGMPSLFSSSLHTFLYITTHHYIYLMRCGTFVFVFSPSALFLLAESYFAVSIFVSLSSFTVSQTPTA